MKAFIYSVLLLLSVILQVAVVDHLALFTIIPDLSIILLGLAALGTNRNYATLAGFLTGFLRDVLGYGIPGVGSLLFSVCGFIAGSLFSKRVFHKKLELLLVFAVYIFLYFFLAHFFINFMSTSFWSGMLKNILPRVLYTLIIMGIVILFAPEKIWKKSMTNTFDSY
ncbi:MAG TPA: rod shape-determining protein MreD [bacterium]|nr:rod shape-determining protein MreD [bacterium]HPN44883.1 rod shape-determining protein MreD [bacterium]